MVVFQSLVNLTVKDKGKYFPFVLEAISKNEIPSFNYRLNYNLIEFKHFQKIITKSDVISLKEITIKKDYSKEVVEELISDLDTIYSFEIVK